MTYITDLLRDYDFKTSPIAITPSSGIYDISYTVLTSTTVSTITDSSATAYYAGTDEASPSLFGDLSTAQTNAITAILEPSDFYSDSFSDVTNVSFASGPNGIIAIGQNTNADSLFVNDSNVADNHVAATTFEYGVGATTVAEDGDVWLNSQFLDGWSTVSAGSEQYLAILHELGHAMGLQHPDPTGLIVDDGQDNQKYTVMGEDLTYTNPDMASSVHPSGLQLYDILALQSLYGMNWYTRNDDTVYSIGHGFGADATKAFMYTIWDGGGTDVIDATGYSGAEIDLRQGHFSSIGLQSDSGSAIAFDTPASSGTDEYDAGNVAIAYNAIIENAIGTSSADTLIGNAWNNVLYGAGGNDTIYGDGITYDTVAGNVAENTFADASGTTYAWGPDAIAPATNLSGDDILIGGAGDDYFYGGKGNDIIHGGYNASDIAGVDSGWDPAGEFTGTNNAAATALSNISYSSDGTDTADYSKLPDGSSSSAGITVTYDNTSASNPISVEKGSSDEYGIDALFSIEKIVGTPWNDTFSGTVYSGGIYIYGSAGSDSVDVGGGSTTVDYSLYSGSISVTSSGDNDASVTKSPSGTDTLTSVSTIIGTNLSDDFYFGSSSGEMTFKGGASGDHYEVGLDSSGTVNIVEASGGGLDTVVIDEGSTLNFTGLSSSGGHETMNIAVESDWNSGTSTFDDISYLTINTSTLGDAYGVELVVLDDYIVRATDLYNWLSTTTDDIHADTLTDAYDAVLSSLEDSYIGGTGGTGAGGGVLPTYDGSGNVTSMQIDPTLGGSPISYSIADVIDHPMVLTSFSESFSGGTYTATTSWQTYEKAFDFIPGISASDVRLTASGSQGDAALTINIDSIGFSLTISNFETGQTISGIEVYNSTLHGLIQDASGSTLVSTGTNTFGGSYLTLTGLDVDTSASVTEHYFLEALNFASGASIDLTAPITFTGTDSGETLTGLDDRADTIYGMGGDDTIYGYGGNDTLIGGAGNDDLYGGTGNDTYVFAAGWGSDTVHENTGEGTDTLHFTGIAPSDIRMYTDAYGDLHLVQISDPSNSVTVNAGVTGSGDSESAVGSYVESVTFDSSYSTTWDLTGGLNLTGDNSGDYLYGTAYADTITGGTGADVIYGNGGNDTIIGGAGADYLYGGTGNDTYVFSSGFGNATVHENTGEGTDTIHFTGINPADIRMWTDAYGNLMLQDTSDTSHSITVNAGVTGSGTSESAIGSYVESVTFDSSYSTTWDLTGGLHITGDNSGDYLYGTAYGDTITGGTGDDVIYGNGGNDTIIGGAGADYLYGGTGNDTYVFSAGFGNATVHENTGEGTDAIHFTGINPADIRMWTDAYGNLMLQDTSDTSHSITVNAGVTGSGTSESAIGSYVESVTFDSSYSTTWDLTGGLHITGDNSGDFLYGTAYGDTITGGTGADVIYGNGGNDTIIGGAGDDYLYGGTGNDTYVFSSGFGNATVHENLSEGTDTIHFSGIDPADIRLWTDAYGNLMLQDTSDTSHSITVNAGVTGDNTSESTVGSYVESVTFDSGYSTTWDLTGGLHITGDNSGDYLYGTAYGDTITGGTGDDVIYANAGDDVLYGAGGNDQLTGGPGADTFLFKAATAETGVATIMDFNTSDGDKIDLADVISTYDPATMAIANFVQIATSGSDTQVKVDTDGSGTSYTQIATIQGVTGLNLADLITDGNLIVHHT
jgi:Ca2+-binding RTX toxin-like protein